MSKRKNKPSHRTLRAKPAKGKKRPAAPGGATSPDADSTQLIIERPIWSEASGELSWKGEVVLRLANNAHSERAILREFQRRGWIWFVRDPIESATIGNATQERRHAIHALKKRQGKRERIHFFSLQGGHVGWCDARWLAAG